MYRNISRFNLPVLATVLFFMLYGAPLAYGQRLQVQLHAGPNFSEAFLHDDALSARETSIFYDSIGDIQLGLAVNLKVFKHLHVRLDGNYKNFRTFFQTESSGFGGERIVLGNLYKENWTFSVLPEFRINVLKKAAFELPLYAFAGAAFSFEQGKNFVYALVIQNGSETYETTTKPDVAGAWSVGAGINPKWRRFGLLGEGRYTRTSPVSEGGPVSPFSFGHFTLLFGLTFDLLK